MHSNLKRHIITDRTEQWHEARKNLGVGSSDAACLLNMSPYKSKQQLFYEKVGLYHDDFVGSIDTVFGIMLEDNVAEFWKYYAGSVDSMVDNFNTGTKVRECHKLPGITVSPDIIGLASSVDMLISEGGFSLITGEIFDTPQILELKTISHEYLRYLDYKCPQQYKLQTLQQMLVTGCRYAEVAALCTDKKLYVWPMDYDQELGEQLRISAEEFWNDVLRARELIAEGKEELALELRPEITEQEAGLIEDFQKKIWRISKPRKEVVATSDVYEDVCEYVSLGAVIKDLENKKKYHKTKVAEYLKDAEILKYGDDIITTYKSNTKGTRVFKIPRGFEVVANNDTNFFT